MFDPNQLINSAIAKFFSSFFEDFIKFFAGILSDIMNTSYNILSMPLVVNGTRYAQALALTILGIKVMNEAFQTYILYQNGDPDADPSGLVIRTGQAVAVIATLPWIVQQVFTFGTKLTSDVANLDSGKAGIPDWTTFIQFIISTGGVSVALIFSILVIMLIIIAIQATIRGAELALMSVIGPIMALNLSSNNRSIWAAWFRQLIIICCSQALQILLLSGAISLLTSQAISSKGILFVFGWLWVTIKSPKFIQQFAYSTGLAGTIGGGARSASSMAISFLMKK